MGFNVLEVPMDTEGTSKYPDRGSDELELTLHELIIAYVRGAMRSFGFMPDPPTSLLYTLADTIPQQALAAELHGRIIYALSIIVMPFLAIPLGIGSPRSNRYVGLVLGLVGMLAYQKTIEFGQKVAAVSQLPVWAVLVGKFCYILRAVCLFVYANGTSCWSKHRSRNLSQRFGRGFVLRALSGLRC